MTKTDELIAYISERHPMQSKYLAKVRNEMTDQDIEELGNVLDYFAEDHTIAEMGDAYLLFVEDTLAETKYFVENGSSRYRYSTLEDVIDQVYSNKAYMEKYMLGLQVSGYLWENHRKILGYFRNVLKSTGGHALEIGPGHGQYFAELINQGAFEDYDAIDLSQTSLDMTERFVKRFAKPAKYHLILDDIEKHDFGKSFDFIVMSEVLEHIEHPKAILQKLHELLSENGKLYLNVPINAPEIDHIYLYHSRDEVRELMASCHFRICDEFVATGNGKSVERAEKKKSAINFAFVAKKM